MDNTYRPRYAVGIVACSASKRPDGQTPLTLYRGALFSTTVRHACQRCDRVLIMSAKYGLLELNDPVQWYDTYLGHLDHRERAILRKRIVDGGKLTYAYANPRRILSYLPKLYHSELMLALPHLGAVARPYAGLNLFQLVQVLSNEVKNYGTQPARR